MLLGRYKHLSLKWLSFAASAVQMTQFAKETLPISLEEEMRRSYLDYAMSVIVGRALPDARDGLKPVHRRVLYAMHELNNDWNRPYKKSARIVGDVIGKYHPHGDLAVYDTIVRMAQDFSLRHMLVDGQGNFGSVDGDNAAAMRYTEIRLAKIAHEMLGDIDKETVDFGPNYDGSEKEPLVLPSKLPNLLVNGSAGIAVGMATNIPPHNLNEVVDACLHMLRNPDASIDELMEIIPAPDFPTAGIIYGINGVKDGYRTGRGKVVMRAKCHFEDIDRGQRQAIIVDELPYQVNKKTLQERMAELVHEKKIEGISHIQDESDKSGMRLVIELKRGEVPEVVLNNLYKQTQLQDTFGMNMVALIDGQPRLCNLKDLISVFLQHRREVVTRRTVFTLRKARERGHVLEGLAVALANIDDFIAIIRNAPTPPVAKAELMARPWDSKLVREMLTRTRADGGVVNADDYRPDGLEKDYGMGGDGLYRLSDTQAQEILQMRLQRLTGLEQDKIVAEYKDVMAEIEDLLDILARPERVSAIISDELTAIRQTLSSDVEGLKKDRTQVMTEMSELRERVYAVNSDLTSLTTDLQSVITKERAAAEKRRLEAINKQYKAALAEYNRGRHENSIVLFEEFLKANPDCELSPNAYYWIGENYYSAGNYPKALRQFQEVVDRYQGHDKAWDAQLKIGLTYLQMQDYESTYNELMVIKNYNPGYPQMKIVDKYLKRI